MTLFYRVCAWWPLLPLTALLAIVYGLNQPDLTIVAELPVIKPHLTDALVENFNARTFDLQGLPRYTLSALQLQHYLDDDSSELIAPNLTLQPQVGAATRLTAQRAHVTGSSEQIELFDAVQIARPPMASQRGLTITTDYLKFLPNADLLATDRAVTIRDDKSSTLQAVGFELNNRSQILKLFAQVKVNYALKN
jgi:lipopolysaccharide export system protein LptC